MRFGGLVAVDEPVVLGAARRHHRDHRPERRGQDHGLQLHHGVLQAHRGAHCARSWQRERRSRRCPQVTVRGKQWAATRRGRAVPPGAHAGLRDRANCARVARTFQNIRLFAGMTVLENLLVAQHNVLNAASGYTIGGLLGLESYKRAEKEAIERSAYWLRGNRPSRPRRRSRGRSPLWGAKAARNRARHVHRAGAALPRRARRRPQSARIRRVERSSSQDPRRACAVDPSHRARHGRRHGHFRPHHRARLRAQDRRGHAR